MQQKIKLMIALSLIGVLHSPCPAMDHKNSFDMASQDFKETLLERIPKDLDQTINRHIPSFTFKCPTAEELKTKGGKIDYKDAKGVVFTLANEKARKTLIHEFSDDETIFNNTEEFLNVVISNQEIFCTYTLVRDPHRPERNLTVDFEASGFGFDQIKYDPNLFEEMPGGNLESPHNTNVEFAVFPQNSLY